MNLNLTFDLFGGDKAGLKGHTHFVYSSTVAVHNMGIHIDEYKQPRSDLTSVMG